MKTTDLFRTSSRKLNEGLNKTFGKKIDFESFDNTKLEDARNKLRTQISQIRSESGFNENMESDAYLEAQWMLDAINAELAEREELLANAGVAEVEEGFDPDEFEGSITTDSGEKVYYHAVVDPEQNTVMVDKCSNDDYRDECQADAEAEWSARDADTHEDVATEGDYYYDHDDPRSGSTGAVMKSNIPVFDKLIKDVAEKNPDIKTIKDFVNFYGDKINDVIKQLRSEAEARNASKSRRAAELLTKALQASESIEGDTMKNITEGEIQQASAIVTAKTMVDRVGRWIEELSGMENDTLLQLGDSIRDEIGEQQSKAFIEAAAPAIQQALETLKGTRDTLSQSVQTLATGEAPADMLGAEPAAEPAGDVEGPAEPDEINMGGEAGDEFAAAEPAAGGIEAAGREKRESINYQARLLKVLAG